MKRLVIMLIILGLFVMCPLPAFAGRSVTASVVAQNTGTAGILIREHGTVRISGGATATVTLQRSEDQGTTWIDTGDTWDASTTGVHTFTDFTKQYYRAWVKTSGYTTGTVGLWLGSGE